MLCLAVGLAFVAARAASAGQPADQSFTANFDDPAQLDLFSFTPQVQSYWRIAPDPVHAERGGVLQLLRAAQSEPGKVRRPVTTAMVKGQRWSDFTLTVDLKCTTEVATRGRDLVIVLCYRDPFNLYYVHLSNEQTGAHNVIMKVHDAAPEGRRTIHRDQAPGLLIDREYHRVQVDYRGATGEITVYVDDMWRPHLTATDTQFAGGLVGLGSFNDTGFFDNLRIIGTGVRE